MNIFVLDQDPGKAARYHADQHMKMCLEAAQILSTAIAVAIGKTEIIDGKKVLNKVPGLYAPFNPNHPSCRWARANRFNFMWTVDYGIAIANEQIARFGSGYETTKQIILEACNFASLFPNLPFSGFSIGFSPEKHPLVNITEDIISTYREYYRLYKMSFKRKGAARFTLRGTPEWLLTATK